MAFPMLVFGGSTIFVLGINHIGIHHLSAVFIISVLTVIASGISIIVILCFNGWIKLRQPPPGYYNQRDIPNAFSNGLNFDGEINPVQIRTPPPLIQNPPYLISDPPSSVDSNPSVGGSRDETQSGNNRLYPFFMMTIIMRSGNGNISGTMTVQYFSKCIKDSSPIILWRLFCKTILELIQATSSQKN